VLEEFGEFFAVIVNTVGAVLNTFFHSTFFYLANISVIDVSSVSSQTPITVYFFRFYFFTESFRPSLCNFSPFRVIVFLRRYESFAIGANYSTKSKSSLYNNLFDLTAICLAIVGVGC